MEPEFYAMSPDGVATCTTRTRLPKVTVEGLGQMMDSDELERCTALLANADLQVILYGGTSATFLRGPAWDETLIKRMQAKSSGIPVTTTSGASCRALRALGVQRLSILTPYINEVTERGRHFFEQSGFSVANAVGMQITEDHAIGDVPLERVYRFVRDNVASGADGVFISCTNLRSVGAISALEADLGIPIVSAIQASFWDCLRLAGVQDRVDGFGRLFMH